MKCLKREYSSKELEMKVIKGWRVWKASKIIRHANASCPKAAIKWPTESRKQNLFPRSRPFITNFICIFGYFHDF